MKIRKLFFALIILVIAFQAAALSENVVRIYFFYTPTCLSCLTVKEHLSDLEEKYPLQIKYLNIEIMKNYEAMLHLEKKFKIGTSAVPEIFIGNSSFTGKTEIMEKLDIPDDYRPAVEDYIKKAAAKSEIERTADTEDKDGVFTGCYAINPYNGEKVQLWVADYVLASYGTGVVMAVPAHDQRDFLFAKKYGIPIKIVIHPEGGSLDLESMTEAYVEYGVMVNSGDFDGLVGKDAMCDRIKIANHADVEEPL